MTINIEDIEKMTKDQPTHSSTDQLIRFSNQTTTTSYLLSFFRFFSFSVSYLFLSLSIFFPFFPPMFLLPSFLLPSFLPSFLPFFLFFFLSVFPSFSLSVSLSFLLFFLSYIFSFFLSLHSISFPFISFLSFILASLRPDHLMYFCLIEKEL